MGWLAKRRLRKAITALQGARGSKDMAELVREGGWDILAGATTGPVSSGTKWQRANAIWETYSARDLEQTYQLASIVYACVKLKCITASQAFMEVGWWSKKGWNAVEDHELYQLFRRPNGGQDYVSFTWTVVASLELTGRAYVLKLRNRGGQIIAIQPLPKSWVTPKREEGSGRLLGYVVQRSARDTEVHVPPEDMFSICYPNPADPTGEAGPLQAAIRDLQIDDRRADLLIEMLTNIHFPGIIMKSDVNWTEESRHEARDMINELVGPGKRGNPLFVNGAKSDVQLPQPPSDLDWPGTAAICETRICAAHGVPPILIHLRSGLEHATYSNYGEARRSLYNDGMRPLWLLLGSGYERGLLIDEGEEKLEIEPDFSTIPEMQEDLDKLHTRTREDLMGSLIDWDEAREKVGEKPLPGGAGRVFFRAFNVQEVRVTAAGTTVTGANPAEEATPEEEHEEDWDGEKPKPDTETDEDEEDDADDEEEDAGAGKSIIVARS
jgi:HK97 family phage portal protein